MVDIKKTIENWVNTITLPSNSPISIGTIRTFTKNNRTIESFNNLTHCKFIEYNSEKRIVIPSGNLSECYNSHYFTVYKYDNYIVKYEHCFDRLICDLIGSIYEEGNNSLNDTIKINIKDTQNVLKYFSIDYDFCPNKKGEDYRIEDDYYLYEGDGWDYCAEDIFHDSDLYEKLKSALIKYFKYECSPYTKYNPDFNPFEIDTRELTLDEKLEKMSNIQIAKILVNYLNIDGVFVNKSDAIGFCMILVDKINDKKLLKNLLLSLTNKNFNTLDHKEYDVSKNIEYNLNI